MSGSKNLDPEIVHMQGNVLVPAKAVSYIYDKQGRIVEQIKPERMNLRTI
jgi:hypothetical protein